jgi:hypothetical protein
MGQNLNLANSVGRNIDPNYLCRPNYIQLFPSVTQKVSMSLSKGEKLHPTKIILISSPRMARVQTLGRSKLQKYFDHLDK